MSYIFKESFNGLSLNVEGTLVETDQGLIPIEMINDTNTIQNVKVIGVIQTISFDTHLISIEKNALNVNYPNKKTIMSQSNKIMFKGFLVQVKDLKNTVKIPYNGEKLYNVLLEMNGFMKINNLMCQTLDINDYVANLYKNPNKTEIDKLLNDAKTAEEYTKIALLNL
jgi:hypothetical protein